MSKLTWFFRPAVGFPNSIASAYYYEPETGKMVHYGHINTDACLFDGKHIAPDYLSFYATLRFDEENDLLGPGGEYTTLEAAMGCLEYKFQNGDWPESYWK